MPDSKLSHTHHWAADESDVYGSFTERQNYVSELPRYFALMNNKAIRQVWLGLALISDIIKLTALLHVS